MGKPTPHIALAFLWVFCLGVLGIGVEYAFGKKGIAIGIIIGFILLIYGYWKDTK